MFHEGKGGSWYKGQSRPSRRPSNAKQSGNKDLSQPLSSNPPQHQPAQDPKPGTSATIINVAEVGEQKDLIDFNLQNIEAGHPISFPQLSLPQYSHPQLSLPQLLKERKESLPLPTAEATVPESALNIAKVATFEAEQKLSLARLECEKLEQKVKELSGLLENAQDTIFRLQPYQQKINESDAAAAFGSLCESVENWVGFRLGDAIEDRIIFKENDFDSGSAADLLNLVSPAGLLAFSCHETDEYNVIAIIMQFLINEIFTKEFYCPIDAIGMEFLSTLYQSMRNLEPQRDMATIRTWRSETLNALANRPDFEFHRAERIKQLSISLTQMLRIFIPRADKKELQTSLQTSIVEKAVELAHRLQLSVDRFEVGWTSFSEGYSRHGGHGIKEPHHFECVNLLAGGKTITFRADEQTAQRQHITYILDICPALYCWTIKADTYSEAKVLRKSKILMAMAQPNQPPFQLGPPSESSVTLLGTIFSQLQPKQRSVNPGWLV